MIEEILMVGMVFKLPGDTNVEPAEICFALKIYWESRREAF